MLSIEKAGATKTPKAVLKGKGRANALYKSYEGGKGIVAFEDEVEEEVAAVAFAKTPKARITALSSVKTPLQQLVNTHGGPSSEVNQPIVAYDEGVTEELVASIAVAEAMAVGGGKEGGGGPGTAKRRRASEEEEVVVEGWVVVVPEGARRSGKSLSRRPSRHQPTRIHHVDRCLAISSSLRSMSLPFPSRRALWASRRRHHRHFARRRAKMRGEQFESGAGRSC